MPPQQPQLSLSECASTVTPSQATSPPGALNFSHGPQVACRNVGACRQRARQRRHLTLPALNFKLKAPPSQWHFKLPPLCVHTATPARANFEGSAMILGSHDQITIIVLLWVRSESGHAPLGKFKGNRRAGGTGIDSESHSSSSGRAVTRAACRFLSAAGSPECHSAGANSSAFEDRAQGFERSPVHSRVFYLRRIRAPWQTGSHYGPRRKVPSVCHLFEGSWILDADASRFQLLPSACAVCGWAGKPSLTV